VQLSVQPLNRHVLLLSRDEGDTKEDTGKSMNCISCSVSKGTSRDEDGEKIKPVAFTIIELCLSEGIRQAGS